MARHGRFLAIALWASCCSCFAAATNTGVRYTVDTWDTSKGLPQNSVVALTQTRDGYLWVGTLDGLARFDGVRFTRFDSAQTRGIGSPGIVKLFEDSQENLWVGTDKAGVALVRSNRMITLPAGRRAFEGRLMSICEDSLGAVWLYFADGQLARYRDGKGSVGDGGTNFISDCRVIIAEKAGPVWMGTDYKLFTTGPSSLESVGPPQIAVPSVTNVHFLLASQRGGFWCLADGRVQRWRTNGLERDLGPWNRDYPVSSACEDEEGNLVVGTLGNGVWWFDAKGGAAQISNREGLSHNTVLSLCMDREGSLWVGTDGRGLNRIKRSLFEVFARSEGKTVQSVFEDNQGGLWIGFNGGGINQWKDGVVGQIGPSSNSYVKSVFVDRDQRPWAGTWGQGLQLYGLFRFGTNGIPDLHVQSAVSVIFQDRQGLLWAGAQGGLLCWNGSDMKRITTRDGLVSDSVQAIADDADGNLWVGTGEGLNCLRYGKVDTNKTAGLLKGEEITSLLVDEANNLWIGTRGRGLALMRKGVLTRFTSREGLINDSIRYLLLDDQGQLWMGSPEGLMRLSKKELLEYTPGNGKVINCRVYGESDGLPIGECSFGSQPAACRTRDGKLLFPTLAGLASVDPGRIKTNMNPPPVLIEDILIEGQKQVAIGIRARSLESVTVPAHKERLEIQYTSLNLGAANRTRFKYQLEGHETGWTEISRSEAGVNPTVRYTRLPPGKYRFTVKACNEDGIWNESGASLAITVLPPFWRTWWFIGATSICLLGIIIAAVNYVSTQNLQRQLAGLRQQQALEKERSRIARDIHDQLGASLTQVSLLGELVESDKDSPDEVGAHARQISQTARDTTRALDEIVWTVNPSNDTLDGLVTYVCKYAQDYLGVAGLSYRLDVPTQLPAAVISPEVRHNVFLATKEAVTNIVRHAKATSAWIRLRLEGASFTLEIEDNGRGIADIEEKKASSRNGLRNMTKRMEDLGGNFAITRGSEGGTLVRLTVPMRNS